MHAYCINNNNNKLIARSRASEVSYSTNWESVDLWSVRQRIERASERTKSKENQSIATCQQDVRRDIEDSTAWVQLQTLVFSRVLSVAILGLCVSLHSNAVATPSQLAHYSPIRIIPSRKYPPVYTAPGYASQTNRATTARIRHAYTNFFSIWI